MAPRSADTFMRHKDKTSVPTLTRERIGKYV